LLYKNEEIAQMATLTVLLPQRLKDWVDECVKSGSFSTASDYVQDLIRQDREQREALVRALIEGEESGTSQRTAREIAAAAKAKLSNGQI
jgi:antitoxin ParD1/3/4